MRTGAPAHGAAARGDGTSLAELPRLEPQLAA